MEELYGNKSLSEAERNEKIWLFFMQNLAGTRDSFTEKNNELAIKLKESASTQCRSCDHKAHLHTLTGCSFKNTNKLKERCYCDNPYFVSNM